MQLDHVVLWVDDPIKSVAFFVEVVGMTAVRLDEFRAQAVPYPSVRVDEGTIIDLVPKAMAPQVNAIRGAAGTAGHPTNHICLTLTEPELAALEQRLAAHGTPAGREMTNQFGARGIAPRAFYFRDLDGNIIEARHY